MTDDELINRFQRGGNFEGTKPELDEYRNRLIALARIGAAVKPIDFAVAIAFEIQLEQLKKRDQEKETSEEWQVYNHGGFIAGKIKDALSALPPPPEQQETK